jgi:threonyl-tRNA synthetase
VQIFKHGLKSYRDLPLRLAEFGVVHRYEPSGAMHGLMRVRGFTQDDAHVFCRPDQLEDEILRVLDFTTNILRAFGFDRYDIYLSTRPEKSTGTDEQWQAATAALKKALDMRGLAYIVDPGEGVFYGPKIDIKIKDSLERAWQCSTIQVDFNLPTRFELEFIGEDGKAHQPVMVHRALLGSLERFFGVLIEHYGGAFPLWLAPLQAVVIPVTEKHQAYAREVGETLRAQGVRVHVDDRNEKLGYRIREAQVQKVPYMLVVGDKEVEAKTVSVRHRHAGDLGAQDVSAFAARVVTLTRERANREEDKAPSGGGVS